ncbi:RTA1-domain-containing protein [Cyathus striatus]|nr:RTA1-domain-containing protein [Cyathus striatus]
MFSSDSAINLVKRIPEGLNLYGYEPTKWASILLVALYIMTTIYHFRQVFQYKSWWLIATVCLSGFLEVVGWGARAKSSFDPNARMPYIIQSSVTVLAPTPLIGANFIIMGRIIRRLGPAYSRLSPKLYSTIFLSCDILALLIQGTGGGMAASASSGNGSATTGSDIILFGIVFQLVMVTVYLIVGAEFFWRYFNRKPIRPDRKLESDERSFLDTQQRPAIRGRMTRDLKLMSIALVVSAVFLYIRSIYRTIELADGWGGKIMTTESLFIILEGFMIFFALLTFNIIHPGKHLANDGEPVYEDVTLEYRK